MVLEGRPQAKCSVFQLRKAQSVHEWPFFSLHCALLPLASRTPAPAPLDWEEADMAPLINASVQPYNPAEYIQTAMTGNRVSRKATVLGSQNIILGGKCIIHTGAIIRGDLRRPPAKAPEGGAKEGAPAAGPAANTIVISMGRYCTLGEGCLLRPAYKTYRG